MGRRAAKKGKSLGKTLEEQKEVERRSREEEREEIEEENEIEESKSGDFFACYLLTSVSPRRKGHTYIGFTVNPRRRIRQHNGEIRCGAWRTKRGRPWEMILCIYGFPSNVAALQFEWAWQHPTESLAVRKAASNFKSLSGVANKIKIAYTMLNLPSWESLNLTVNFFSTKYMKHLGGCPRLPKQMKVSVCIMDDLPCYVEGQIGGSNSYDDGRDWEDEEITEDANPTPKSDTSLNRIREGAHSLETSSSDFSNYKESDNLEQEPHSFADSLESGEGCHNQFRCSLDQPQQDGMDSFRQPLVSRCSVNISPGRKQKSISYKEEESPVRCSVNNSPGGKHKSISNKIEDFFRQRKRSLPLKCSNNDEAHTDHPIISPVTSNKTKSLFSDFSCIGGSSIQSMSQSSNLRSLDNETLMRDTLLLPPEDSVIDLSTPSNVRKCYKKRANVSSEIIDLTDSPMVIQL